MALMERRGRKPETVFHAWTDLNSLVRRQLDPEDMKAVEMEANRLNILHSQVSNSGDEMEGSRTSRMKEIFEYKSLHLSTSPKSWYVPSGPSSLVVLRVGRAEGWAAGPGGGVGRAEGIIAGGSYINVLQYLT